MHYINSDSIYPEENSPNSPSSHRLQSPHSSGASELGANLPIPRAGLAQGDPPRNQQLFPLEKRSQREPRSPAARRAACSQPGSSPQDTEPATEVEKAGNYPRALDLLLCSGSICEVGRQVTIKAERD